MVALNAKIRRDGGSERWNWRWVMDLNAEMNDVTALDVEMKMYIGSESWTETTMALDVEMKMQLWTPNWGCTMASHVKWKMALNIELKTNNDSKCQTKKVMALISKWKCGSERRDRDVALNAKIGNMALNTKWKMDNGSECQMKKVMALISKWKCGSERQMENG